MLALEILPRLLEARMTYETSDFDEAIRAMSKVACEGAGPDVLDILAKQPVEALYPVGRLAECKALNCGGCFTVWGGYLYGSAFPTPPNVP